LAFVSLDWIHVSTYSIFSCNAYMRSLEPVRGCTHKTSIAHQGGQRQALGNHRSPVMEWA
jgi:hypothetical protein